MSECGKNDAVACEVIRLVTEGYSTKRACGQLGLAIRSFHDVLARVKDCAVAYARAREIRADLLADEIVEIADTDEDSNRARNRITARQWLASRHNPKTYGDRIDLSISQTISIADTRAEAMARILRPMRDLAPTLDAEVIDMPTLSMPTPSDGISDGTVIGDKWPSIFD